MGQRARVTSIDAVDDFAAALRSFQHEASGALEGVQLRIHRAVAWIEHDQKLYWKHELRRSDDRLQEAKLNLERCLTFKKIGEHRPSCIEEKRAVERAKRRQQLCRQKLDAVRKWSLDIVRAVFEYRAGVSELDQWLETDADRALGLLDRISRTLEQYVGAESSPSAAEAVSRLPWTDEKREKPARRETPEREEEEETEEEENKAEVDDEHEEPEGEDAS
jgi:hypothetical protein